MRATAPGERRRGCASSRELGGRAAAHSVGRCRGGRGRRGGGTTSTRRCRTRHPAAGRRHADRRRSPGAAAQSTSVEKRAGVAEHRRAAPCRRALPAADRQPQCRCCEWHDASAPKNPSEAGHAGGEVAVGAATERRGNDRCERRERRSASSRWIRWAAFHDRRVHERGVAVGRQHAATGVARRVPGDRRVGLLPVWSLQMPPPDVAELLLIVDDSTVTNTPAMPPPVLPWLSWIRESTTTTSP